MAALCLHSHSSRTHRARRWRAHKRCRGVKWCLLTADAAEPPPDLTSPSAVNARFPNSTNAIKTRRGARTRRRAGLGAVAVGEQFGVLGPANSDHLHFYPVCSHGCWGLHPRSDSSRFLVSSFNDFLSNVSLQIVPFSKPVSLGNLTSSSLLFVLRLILFCPRL